MPTSVCTIIVSTTGFGAGVYLAEATYSIKHEIWGREVTFTIGANYGVGAKSSLGKLEVEDKNEPV